MSKWPIVRFHELAAPERSAFSKPYGSAITKEDYVPEGVPVVRGVNLARGIFLDAEFVYISQEKADRMPGANLAAADLVITHRGTIGQVSMIPRSPRHVRYVLSTSQVKARLDPIRALPEFYYYWLTSPAGQREILSNISTVGVPGLVQPVDTVKKLKVPYPPLATQKAVASVLVALDAKIASNERVSIASRDLGQALFARAIETDGTDRVDVSQISTLIMRGGAPHYVDDLNGMVVLNQRCIRHGRIDLASARLTATAKVRPDRMLRAGDVLVNSTGVGTLGRVAMWTNDMAATCDSHITIVRINSELANPTVSGYALLSAQPEIEGLGEGSTGQTELSRHKLGRLMLALPSRTSQMKLAVELDALEQRSRNALEENSSLAVLRDTLLPRLVSGELRIKDAERLASAAGAI